MLCAWSIQHVKQSSNYSVVFNEGDFYSLTLMRPENDKLRRNLQKWYAILDQKVNDRIILEVWEADKRSSSSSSSSPDTWPTFTAASHVTVLLREKAPFVSQRGEGGRSLG